MNSQVQNGTGIGDGLEELATAVDFDQIKRRTLCDADGVLFRDFKTGLKPRYLKVWLDLLAGHAALVVILGGLFYAQAALPTAALFLVIALGALLIGYIQAYIQLFFHEAAHYNIAVGRRRNDVLANCFIGIFVGQSIAQYRTIHFDHHRYLGTTRDTERSYFDPLSPRFLFESLVGLRVLKVFVLRQKVSVARPSSATQAPKTMLNSHLLLGLLLHGTILGLAALLGQWAVAAAWLIGTVVVFPFFGAVRQVLEHRSESARSDVNYAEVDQVAANRIFGDGPLASTLGGAGFNRHLLHHWEPQISYTRFRELESYLLNTPAAGALRHHQTTYWATFRALLRSNERHGAQ